MKNTAVYADLHTHTSASDGALAPSALVRRVADADIRVLSVTDHDTVGGLQEAAEEAESVGVAFVPGVELSVTIDGSEIHLLAYGIEPDHPVLCDHMESMQQARDERVWRIVDRLRDHGVTIQTEDVEQALGDAHAPGRPHVAAALVRGGHVDSRSDAFDRYLSRGQPGFVGKPVFDAKDAIRMIHDAGGVAVLAHPGHWTSSRDIRTLRTYGLDGLETIHPAHDSSLQGYYTRLAQSYGLATTGGSDYHGWRSKDDVRLGTVGMNQALWERFREVVA